MGNCVPVQKNTHPSVKVRILVDSRTETILGQSPIKERTLGSEESGVEEGLKPHASPDAQSFRGLNGTEEVYFDSNPWIDSDYEDYFSVNGDDTPCRGGTPIHQSSLTNSPQLDESLHTDREATPISERSPDNTKRQKQLIELFRESFNDDPFKSDQCLQGQPEIKSITLLSPQNTMVSHFSADNCGGNTREALDSAATTGKVKSARSTQCCIPSVVRSFSLNEKKKRLSLTDG